MIDKSMELEDMEGIKRVVQVGLLCTQEAPSLRPTMTSIIQMLTQKDAPLPTPSKPPFMDEAMAVSLSVASSQRHPSESFDSCRSHNKDYVLKWLFLYFQFMFGCYIHFHLHTSYAQLAMITVYFHIFLGIYLTLWLYIIHLHTIYNQEELLIEFVTETAKSYNKNKTKNMMMKERYTV